MELILRPIGIVRSRIEPGAARDATEQVATLQILPAYTEGLDGIEQFSHLTIVYWLNRSQWNGRLKVHPRGRSDLPLTGVFATRSPVRPNPIAVSVVRLVSRDGNELTVAGLDAFNETPILDIKPFVLGPELLGEVQVPDWAGRQESARHP